MYIVHMTFRYLSLFIFKELFNLDCSAENKVGFYSSLVFYSGVCIHRSKEIKGCWEQYIPFNILFFFSFFLFFPMD